MESSSSAVTVERLGRDGGHPAGSYRHERRGAGPALEMGVFTEESTGAVLGQALAVDLDAKHAVEHQVHLGTRLTLADEGGSRLHLLDPRFGGPPHQLGGKGALEGGLDHRHERLGLLVAPRGVLAEGLAVPVLEVDEPGLGGKVALVVIDPVAGEPACAAQ